MLILRLAFVCGGLGGATVLCAVIWRAADVRYDANAQKRVRMGAAAAAFALLPLLMLDAVEAARAPASFSSWASWYALSAPIFFWTVLLSVVVRTHRHRTKRGWSSGLGNGYGPDSEGQS